jgi:hypothetical protein
MGMTDKEKAMADAKVKAMQKSAGQAYKPAAPSRADPNKQSFGANMATFGKKFANNAARQIGVEEPFEDARLRSGYHEPKK